MKSACFKLENKPEPVNLYGFYEAVPGNAEDNSGFTIQVNQVGLTLVGWISQLDATIRPASPVKTLPSLPPGNRIGFGVFEASLTPASLSRLKVGEYLVSFQWSAFEQPPEKINVFDPIVSDMLEGTPHSGTLRLAYVSDPNYTYLGVRSRDLGLLRSRAGRLPGSISKVPKIRGSTRSGWLGVNRACHTTGSARQRSPLLQPLFLILNRVTPCATP